MTDKHYIISPQQLELLDWEHIISPIIQNVHFDKSKEIVASLPTYKSKFEIENHYDQISKIIELTNHDSFNNLLSNIRSISASNRFFDLVPQLTKSKYCSLMEINGIISIVELYHFLVGQLHDSITSGDQVKLELREIDRKLIKEFRSFVEKDGSINYLRHNKLAPIFQKIKEIENSIRDRINKIARSDLFFSRLQFDQYDIIYDRFVLAIRSDSYQSNLGSIISRSSSGNTLFVEPTEIHILSNTRIELINQLEEAIEKLGHYYSSILHSFSSLVAFCSDKVIEVDILVSKSIYSSDPCFSRPEIAEQFHLTVEDFFHPLVENPVKNSFQLTVKDTGIVISGPNTGGKTVLLKTIGVCLLSVHYGIYTPATYASIYPAQKIFFFSHDNQDLTKGLSSFAAEALNYLSLTKQIQDYSVVLIDEIFNTTSSDEASALAIALLQQLTQKAKIKIILSTHHQLLKTKVHIDGSYISSHVGFDDSNSTPTYKLIIGDPGGSRALSIFKTLEIKQTRSVKISEHAENLIDKGHVSYEKLLQELDQKNLELQKLLDKNKQLNLDLKNRKEALDLEIESNKAIILRNYKKELDQILANANHAISDFKENKINQKRLENDLHQVSRKFIVGTEKVISKENTKQHAFTNPAKKIVIGQKYYSSTLNTSVTITSINEKKELALITNKNFKQWVAFSTLFELQNRPSNRIIINAPTIDAKLELDCRGYRRDDFITAVERQLIALSNDSIPYLDVIHGHGDGVLKSTLKEILKKYNDFESNSLDGNDGCSRITKKS